ncbi:cation transport ATPase [Arthrobacter sp. UYNi723]
MDAETFTRTRIIELDIEGMTCASRVARVERKLGKLDGVEASVNLPLESAQVTVSRLHHGPTDHRYGHSHRLLGTTQSTPRDRRRTRPGA